MKIRSAVALLFMLPLAGCDRDPPAEDALEEAEETLEEMPDPLPVPVPVPVDTTLRDTLVTDTLGGA